VTAVGATPRFSVADARANQRCHGQSGPAARIDMSCALARR